MNIQYTLKNGLCTSCGGCFVVCPKGAIYMVEYDNDMKPVIDPDLCNDCGLCYKVCSGIGYNKSLGFKDNFFMQGPVKWSIVGHSTDNNIRKNAQSGGIASAIMIYALEHGIIDGALVTELEWGTPPRPKSKIVTTREDVLKARGSIYIPTTVLPPLRDIMGTNRKIGVLGDGCALISLEHIKQYFPGLKNNIVFTVGLHCSGVETFNIMEDIFAKRVKINLKRPWKFIFRNKQDAKDISYQGQYPPFIRTETGKHYLKFEDRVEAVVNFKKDRCKICDYFWAPTSDISLGDAHGVLKDLYGGDNSIYARTDFGVQLLKSMQQDKAVELYEETYERIYSGQCGKKNQFPDSIVKAQKQWKQAGKILPKLKDVQ